jgi:hypothetical protein
MQKDNGAQRRKNDDYGCHLPLHHHQPSGYDVKDTTAAAERSTLPGKGAAPDSVSKAQLGQDCGKKLVQAGRLCQAHIPHNIFGFDFLGNSPVVREVP